MTGINGLTPQLLFTLAITFFTESDKSWLGGSLHGNEARGMSTLYSHLVKIAEIVLVTQKVRIGATRTTQLMY